MEVLLGKLAKAREKQGRSVTPTLEELIGTMVNADMRRVERE